MLLAGISGILAILFVCGIVADYVLPRIPAVKRFIDSFENE